MKVYCYDDNGFFVGEEIADESPLEPGVFLVPGHSTEQAPIKYKEGFWPRWNGNEWELVDVRPQSPEPLTRDQVQLNRLAAYAHPVTGSDRFIIEASAMRLDGDVKAAETAEKIRLG